MNTIPVFDSRLKVILQNFDLSCQKYLLYVFWLISA